MREAVGKQFWRQEWELVLDVFNLPVPIGCPDRHGCVCRPGRYPVEVSVWEMSVMELLGRSLSPDVSQTEKRSEDWAWVLTAQTLVAKRRTLQRRLRRKGQCLQPVALIPNISEILFCARCHDGRGV